MKKVLFALATSIISTNAFAWTSWIGVLEDWPVKAKPELPVEYESRVRPLFVKIDSGAWQSAPKAGSPSPVATLPKAFSWDVCFSGRGEGTVTAMLADNSASPSTPPYALREGDKAPWRTRRSNDYAGWIQEPVYKPIILSSALNSSCRDPEKWRSGPGDKARTHLAAMIQLTNTELAKIEPGATVQDSTAKIPRAWGTQKHGRFAVLKAKNNQGKEVQATFFIGESGPNFIGFGAMMVDAGDFDSDGVSEVVFKQKAEKKDIYALYHGGTKIAETFWDYTN